MAIVIAVGLVVSVIAFLIASRAEERRVYRGLELRVEWRAKDLRGKINLARRALVATAIRVTVDSQIDVTEFNRFTNEAAAGNRSIASIAWVTPVPHDQRADLEAAAGFPIVDADANGTRNAADRDGYMPVVLQNRFDGRPLSLGLDLSVRPRRRLAMELARDSGVPKAVTIPDAALAAEPTYLIFWPIFDTETAPETVPARRAHLRGYVVGAFRVVDVLNAAIADTPDIPENIDFYLSDDPEDGAIDAPARLVASYTPTDRVVRAARDPAAVPGSSEKYRFIRPLDIEGQHWRVESLFLPPAVARERSIGPLAVLVAGLLLTALLAAYVVRGLRQVSLVRTLVDRRTIELTQTNTKLEALIDASPHAIVCLDAERRVILWNSAAEHLFGYVAKEVLHRPYPLVLPDERKEFDDRFKRLSSGEVLRNLASHRRHRDGTAIDTSSSAAAFYDAAGALLGVVFIIEDTRERNLVQHQLRQAQKMEAIGQLTGGLAHDFNNLLGIVLGNLDLLAERFTAGGEDRELVDAAVQAALRGAELTRQLLAFSRRQPLAPKLIHLPPALEATAKLLRRTLGEAIILELSVSDALWPVLIDLSQLGSTLLNLSVNARDAMPNGGRLTIEANNVVIDDRGFDLNLEAIPGDYVLIAISDTGSGMPAEVLAHAFEPFFTTKGNAGTGLGLSMVHGFLKQSGGYTKIYSEPEHGTTVRLYLPRALDGPLTEQAADQEMAPAEPVARSQETILVVEDNKGMMELALQYLQSLGYRTLSAADGASALEIIRGSAPLDLLFTDVVMPGGMDGRALAKAARRFRPQLRILFTSGFTAAAASAATEDQFGSNLLSKPYRKSELARRIRAALDASEG